MRLPTRFLLLVLLFLSACNNFVVTKTNVNPSGNAPLSEFILGKWQGVEQTHDFYGSYVKQYQIEFIDEKTLKLTMSSPYDGFTEEFQYQFISPSTLKVENSRTKGGEWQISRSGEKLLVCIWSNQDCIVFTRYASFQLVWLLWILIFLIAVLIILLVVRYIRKHSHTIQTAS